MRREPGPLRAGRDGKKQGGRRVYQMKGAVLEHGGVSPRGQDPAGGSMSPGWHGRVCPLVGWHRVGSASLWLARRRRGHFSCVAAIGLAFCRGGREALGSTVLVSVQTFTGGIPIPPVEEHSSCGARAQVPSHRQLPHNHKQHPPWGSGSAAARPARAARPQTDRREGGRTKAGLTAARRRRRRQLLAASAANWQRRLQARSNGRNRT